MPSKRTRESEIWHERRSDLPDPFVPGAGAQGRSSADTNEWNPITGGVPRAPVPLAEPTPGSWARVESEPVGEELLHVRPGPGILNISEEEWRERMSTNSPDGRPPSLRDERVAKRIFFAGFITTSVAVLTALFIWAGPLPALLGVLLSVFFIGIAAWPTWHAAMDRKFDEERLKHEVLEESMRVDRAPPSA